MIIKCDACTKEFERPLKRINYAINKGYRQYCSKTCLPSIPLIDCVACKKSTNNPKFCSRSCSVSFNNEVKPKRVLEGNCYSCKTPITSNNKYCKSCWSQKNVSVSTKYEIFNTFGTYQAHAKIRGLARTQYSKSGFPKKCKICGYDKHVQICHIIPVASFPGNTLISNMNDITNLQALCPNHHWEVDHNKL